MTPYVLQYDAGLMPHLASLTGGAHLGLYYGLIGREKGSLALASRNTGEAVHAVVKHLWVSGERSVAIARAILCCDAVAGAVGVKGMCLLAAHPEALCEAATALGVQWRP